MKTISYINCVHALLLMAFFGSANGGERTYTIGVQDFEYYLPYSQYSNKTYDGLGKAIIDLFARKKGYAFIYKAYPIRRANSLFFSGELDFKFPDNPYWAADEKIGLHIKYAPILDFTDGVVVLPANKGKGISNIKRLGIPLGFTPIKYIEFTEGGKIMLFETYRYNELYSHVQAGRVDGAYVNTRVANYYFSHIKKASDFPIVFDPGLPHTTGFHSISSLKYPEIISEIDAFLKDSSNKAAIDELKIKYQFD